MTSLNDVALRVAAQAVVDAFPPGARGTPRADALDDLRAALSAVSVPTPLDVERLAAAICNGEASRAPGSPRYDRFSEEARDLFRKEARDLAREYAALAAPQPVPEEPNRIPVDPEAAGDYPSDGPYAPNGPEEPA